MQALTISAVALILIWSIAAVKTVIPSSVASKPCLLGYKATCSFTPISTAICVLGTVITFAVSKNIIVG
jgi:hypothetical protein